jgi:predicted transcriptional regulator
MKSFTTALTLAAVPLVLLLVFTGIHAESSEKLISFRLKDQHKKLYTDLDYRGKLFLTIGSDKEGREFNPMWTIAIKNALKDDKKFKDLQILRVADMRGAPEFIRPLIASKFPKERSEWVVLDWEGVFPETYGFKKKIANILIFDKKGRLVYQDDGKEPEKEKLNKILKIIRKNYSPEDSVQRDSIEYESGYSLIIKDKSKLKLKKSGKKNMIDTEIIKGKRTVLVLEKEHKDKTTEKVAIELKKDFPFNTLVDAGDFVKKAMIQQTAEDVLFESTEFEGELKVETDIEKNQLSGKLYLNFTDPRIDRKGSKAVSRNIFFSKVFL